LNIQLPGCQGCTSSQDIGVYNAVQSCSSVLQNHTAVEPLEQ